MADAPTTGRRYGGLTPEERLAERRSRLLAAGLELFGTRGYAATTIESLCAEANVAPRYFYEQFADREALLLTVYDDVIAQVYAEVAASVADAPADLRARVTGGIAALVRSMVADERRARIAYLEVPGASPTAELHRREVVRSFGELQVQQIRDVVSLPPERDLRMTAMALSGAVNELVLDWLVIEERPPLESLVAELIEIYVAALGGG